MTTRAFRLAVALGALGGATLVLSAFFVTGVGKLILLPWAAVVLGVTLGVRAERLPSFGARFACSLTALVLASLALYVAILLSPGVQSIGFAGHTWRLAFVVAVGAAISLATARIAAAAQGSAPPTSQA
jgi:hypothetical protein